MKKRRKETEWNTYRDRLVTFVILLALCSVVTTKTLSIIADRNMAMTGSGRTTLTKGKENFLTYSTEYKGEIL